MHLAEEGLNPFPNVSTLRRVVFPANFSKGLGFVLAPKLQVDVESSTPQIQMLFPIWLHSAQAETFGPEDFYHDDGRWVGVHSSQKQCVENV